MREENYKPLRKIETRIDQVDEITDVIEKSPPLPDLIVFRGMTPETADRLLRENIFTNKGFTDTSLDVSAVCNPDDHTNEDTWYNIMAIYLPQGTQGLVLIEKMMIVLQRGLTMKCIGVKEFPCLTLDNGAEYNTRMFMLELKV